MLLPLYDGWQILILLMVTRLVVCSIDMARELPTLSLEDAIHLAWIAGSEQSWGGCFSCSGCCSTSLIGWYSHTWYTSSLKCWYDNMVEEGLGAMVEHSWSLMYYHPMF